MNIRDVSINTSRADGARNGYVNGVSRVAGSYAAGKSAGEVSGRDKDTVEISEAGRAAAGQTRELGAARKALDSIPSMSAARAAEVRGRIESGFYNKPEVTKAIAASVTDEIRGK